MDGSPFMPSTVRQWDRPVINRSRLGDLSHVLSLRTFWPVDHFELHFLPLYQGLISVAGYGAVMDENVLFAGLLNKSISLGIVKPFDLTDSLRHHNLNPPANFK